VTGNILPFFEIPALPIPGGKTLLEIAHLNLVGGAELPVDRRHGISLPQVSNFFHHRFDQLPVGHLAAFIAGKGNPFDVLRSQHSAQSASAQGAPAIDFDAGFMNGFVPVIEGV
jgi:hypothetical protein